MKKISDNEQNLLTDEQRYGMNCTFVTAQRCVVTPWNRMTIPRRHAVLCTMTNAHFIPSN